MIDSHAHLDSEKYNFDRSQIIKRAQEAGIVAIINPGADFDTLDGPVKLAEKFEGVFAAVGVHPYESAIVGQETFQKAAKILESPKVVAVGEVGLENSHGMPEMQIQINALQGFMEVAKAANKPLIFHVRDAHAEFQNFIQNQEVSGVMHCFVGSLADAEYYVKKGLYLGITAIVTFPNAQELQDVVKKIPLSSLLVETDAPFLAPQVHRGERNEPIYVLEVAKKIAELKGVSLEEVEKITTENAKKLFRL